MGSNYYNKCIHPLYIKRMSTRKIIHIDMDAFYAAVEMRDNPSLKNLPIAVGGHPNERGVIATANYKARKYGVRSAMPSWKAKQLCPDLLIIFPHFEKYKEESRAIHDILESYTDIIEPLSLDEAYLDVTGSEAFGGSGTLIAQEIKKRIWKERRLTASAGVAPNKFLAKVASDWNKPNGLFVLIPEMVDSFVRELPIEKIFGIGHVMAKKMHAMGIYTCQDLQELDLSIMQKKFGKRAWILYNLCRGIDHSPVHVDRIRKSLSVESTFLQNIESLEECTEHLMELFQRLENRILKREIRIKKIFVKIKFFDFTVTTVESILYPHFELEGYKALIKIGWERKKIPIRLIGIGVHLNSSEERQLTLFNCS